MSRRVKLVSSLLIILALYLLYSRYQRQEQIDGTLAYGRLAPLPSTATQIEVETEGSLFSRTFWLSFQAPDAEIDAWIRHSPSLAPLPSSPFSPLEGSHADAPSWFTPEAIEQGQVFTIPWNQEQLHGTVWIDAPRRSILRRRIADLLPAC